MAIFTIVTVIVFCYAVVIVAIVFVVASTDDCLHVLLSVHRVSHFFSPMEALL